MFKVLANYNYSPDWLDEESLVFDRSDDEIERTFPCKVIRTRNIGNVDFDKLGYLVENYDSLPDIFLWGKTNLWKYISTEEFAALPKGTFTPLLTQNHQEREGISFYKDGMYHEYANVHTYGSWIGARNWKEWASYFHLPIEETIPFAPGGNYILTRERVLRHPRELYATMRAMLPYSKLPGEAHLAERSYFYLWR